MLTHVNLILNRNIGVDAIVMVAFWYSLVFAVLRTTLTIFVTSSMNDYERKIITSLRDVPSKAWNTEVSMIPSRFVTQILRISSAIDTTLQRATGKRHDCLIGQWFLLFDALTCVSCKQTLRSLHATLCYSSFSPLSQMGTTIITYELMISDVINQATIRQRTVYC